MTAIYLKRRRGDKASEKALLGKEGLKGDPLITVQLKDKSYFHSEWFHPSPYLPHDCLANHPRVTRLEVFLVCCGLFGVFALFFAAHNDRYAELLLVTRRGRLGLVTSETQVLQASLADSLCNFWNNGAYIFGVLTALGTGLMPYIKCYMMTYCFFAPRSVLLVGTRKKLLQKLSHLNKLTLSINIAMAILSVISDLEIAGLAELFRDLDIPLLDNIDLLEISLFVDVDKGFFLRYILLQNDLFSSPVIHTFFLYPLLTSLAGCVLSQLVGIWILYIHRMNEEPVPLKEATLMQQVGAQVSSSFGASFDRMNEITVEFVAPASSFMAREEEREGLGKACSRQLATVAVLMFAFVTVMRAAFEDSYSVEFAGLLARVIPSEEREPEYSFVDFLVNFADSSSRASLFGIRFTQIILVMATFALPMLHIAMLLALYVLQLQPYEQWQLFYGAELVSGASCLHVFCGVIFVLFLELGPLVKSITRAIEVGDNTAEIIANNGGIIRWSVDLNEWFYLLFVGSLLILGANAVILAGGEERVMERILLQHEESQQYLPDNKSFERVGPPIRARGHMDDGGSGGFGLVPDIDSAPLIPEGEKEKGSFSDPRFGSLVMSQ
jgi:hypothetical protein